MSEEFKTIIAKAEAGDVAAMNQLTHIYGEVDGCINHEQAAKWFLELIKRDCNPKSDVYEKTGYDSTLYMQVKNAILNSNTEEDMTSAMSNGNSGSLLGGAMFFTTSRAKTYIDQSDKTIEQHVIYKEEQRRNAAEEAARKKTEEEARQRAEEEARKKEEERRKKEAEAKRKAEEAERARKKAEEERVRKAAADREAAKKVIDKIAYIGDVEYTEDCKIYITSARTAYDSLTVDQKELVNNFNILIASEKEFYKLQKAEEKKVAEEKARREAEEEARRREEERKRKAEEAARKKAEKEAAALQKAKEEELARRKAELEARKKAEAEAKKRERMKEIESLLKEYCLKKDNDLSIEWKRLGQIPSIKANEIEEFLEQKIGEQYIVRSTNTEYIIKLVTFDHIGAHKFKEARIKKEYLEETQQKQAEEQILINKKRKQIENDSYSSVYKEEVGRFVIPEDTQRIGNKIFFECAKLRAISIPDSVTSVGDEAFSHCTHLESVCLPNNVTSLGRSAFYGCRELTSIDLGDSLTKIENYTFAYCCKLTSIVLPNSITYINDSAFEYCSDLKSITLPLNLEYIGDRVFNGCRSLEEIIVPRGKKEEYLSLLKHNYLSDNIRIVEKNYTSRKQTNRDASHKSSSPKKQSGGFLSRLWNLLTDD